MLFFAISIVFICGCAALAVDYGLLVNDKNQWQRGVDAAALAGAQELKKTGNDDTDTAKARSVAIAVAGQNGVTLTNAGISFLDDNTKIRVASANTRPLYFARVVGISMGTVDAIAIAGVSGGGSTSTVPPRVVPVGITQETVATYTTPQLNNGVIPLTIPRVVSEPYEVNKFIVFDLRPQNSKSPSAMQSQLINGYTETKVGDLNTSLNASDSVVNNNFVPALADRFLRASLPPWNDIWTGSVFSSSGILYDGILNGTARADNPRVVFLIVNRSSTQSGGTTNHEVLDFQPVYIQGWQNNTLLVRFLPKTFDGTSTTLGGSTDKVVSLIQ